MKFEINDIKEELLCCHELPNHTSLEIFKIVNTYIENNSLDWKYIAMCTDESAIKTVKYSGVTAKIKEVAADGMLIAQCFIHREHLAAKKMSCQLNSVISESIKIINFIVFNAFKSRLFSILCEAMEFERDHLLLHAEV